MGHLPRWMRPLAAIASGLMTAGLFAPVDATWMVWFSLLPLLAALWSVEGKRRGCKGFGLGLIGGVVACGLQFCWLGTVSWLAAAVLSFYLALYWAAFGAFAASWGNPWRIRCAERGSGLVAAFATGSAWALLELLRGWLFTGFGWNGLGVAFHETPVFAQAADLFGVGGLSLGVVSFQALLLTAVRRRLSSPRGGLVELAVATLSLALAAGYGAWRISSERSQETLPLKTLLIQINIPQEAAQMLWTGEEIHMAYEEDTRAALADLDEADWPDWVMWPEAALVGRVLRTDDGAWATWQENLNTIEQVRTAGDFELIFGVNELEAELDATGHIDRKPDGNFYNSLAVLSPDNTLQTFRKRHLVIFGETIPFIDTLPWLKRIYEQQSGAEYGGSFTPGESLEPLSLPLGDRHIGGIPTVCFEDSVPRLVRKFVRPGPQVIINVTNDGWFKESAAAAQHFANARFRAIELRRPLIRCSNNGVSAAVDTTGSTAHPATGEPQILADESGSHFTRGHRLIEVEVPVAPSATLYAAWGDVSLILLSAIGLLMQAFPRRCPGNGSAAFSNG